MPSTEIQWFPGHMAKTRRLITECLPSVDIVFEVLDARVPLSSQNPSLPSMISTRPSLVLLNKATMADPEQNRAWKKHLDESGRPALLTDCISGLGMNAISGEVQRILHDKLEKYESRGMSGRHIRAMIVGIPNVGKSSVINRLAGSRKAKVEDRPGVTLTKQWVQTNIGVDLLDMPGVLWPKFEDKTVGENLAVTGAIKDDILDIERIAIALTSRLRRLYPSLLSERYKLGDMSAYDDTDDYELFLLIGKKRGFLVSGGETDTERTANMLLNEFRTQKIGKITLERP